jgi:plasmid stabilization system protein ParE
MNAPFLLTPQATEDLDAIWWFIAQDNRDAAVAWKRKLLARVTALQSVP